MQPARTSATPQVATAPAAVMLPTAQPSRAPATLGVIGAAAVSTPVRVPVSSTPAPTEAADPTRTVRNFYADLKAKDFAGAWDLLSPEYQATLNFDSWVDGYGATQSVQVTSAEVAAQEGTHATVQIEITAVDSTDAGVRTTQFAGTWAVVLAGGSWKLDKASIQQISDRRVQSPQVAPPQAQTGSLAAAVERVQQEGYIVSDPSTYSLQFGLNVLIGTATASADGYNRRAFFFLGDRYLGTDASEPSASVALVWREDTTVALQYALYRAADPMCCPTAGAATVRFHWTGSQLQSLDPIPPTSMTATRSRR